MPAATQQITAILFKSFLKNSLEKSELLSMIGWSSGRLFWQTFRLKNVLVEIVFVWQMTLPYFGQRTLTISGKFHITVWLVYGSTKQKNLYFFYILNLPNLCWSNWRLAVQWHFPLWSCEVSIICAQFNFPSVYSVETCDVFNRAIPGLFFVYLFSSF